MSDPETLQLLKYAVERLETLGIRYFITGSVAAMLVGKPRLTHDIDIVVAMDRCDLPRLENAFPSPRFYFNDIAVWWKRGHCSFPVAETSGVPVFPAREDVRSGRRLNHPPEP